MDNNIGFFDITLWDNLFNDLLVATFVEQGMKFEV